MVTENKFQSQVIKELNDIFPSCIILKNDTNYIQGFPDLLILTGEKWAALEIKKSKNSHRQPNQQFFIEVLDHMSFARVVYPENLEEVLDELQQSFGT